MGSVTPPQNGLAHDRAPILVRRSHAAPGLDGRPRLRVFHPIFYTGCGISHICLSLCQHLEGCDVELVVPGAIEEARRPFIKRALPAIVPSVMYRAGLGPRPQAHLAAMRWAASLSAGDVVYLWPGTPLWVYERVKAKGCTLVMERINCHRATARRILDEAYQRAGLEPTHGLTEPDARRETRQLELADHIFSPSPAVEASLIDIGIPRDKIFRSSYGWDPGRITPAAPRLAPTPGLNAAFVGSVCIRKGAHLLLDAWARAQVRGRLIFAGIIDEPVRRVASAHMARADVAMLGFEKDVASVFASANLFAFPTLEEGSPLVVYEAMASGLPILTTPMGAGHIVRDGVEGFIIDAYDTQGWVDRMRALQHEPELLRAMGEAARHRAQEFTWDRVAQRRSAMLVDALSPRAARPEAEPALAAAVA